MRKSFLFVSRRDSALELFFFFLLSMAATQAVAQAIPKSMPLDPNAGPPSIAPRELLVFKTGVDGIWGTAIAAVMNRTPSPQEFSFVVNLPREMVDFQASEGVDAKDLTLGEKGVVVHKTFAPAVNVVGVTFKVPAHAGSVNLTFSVARELPEMIFMTPSGLLKLTSPQIVFDSADDQQGERYDLYKLAAPIAAGETLNLQITGIPAGRSSLWWVGGIFAVILAGMTGFLGWRTRPGLGDNRDDVFV